MLPLDQYLVLIQSLTIVMEFIPVCQTCKAKLMFTSTGHVITARLFFDNYRAPWTLTKVLKIFNYALFALILRMEGH